MFWYCNECVVLVRDRLGIAKRLESLERHVVANNASATEILSKLENKSNSLDRENQWSSIVQRNKFPPLIIKPKNTGQDSVATKKSVVNKINPSDLSVEIKKVKQVSQGRVFIECNDRESLKKLQDKVESELSDEYTVEIPKIANPKVLIVGIQEKFVNNEEEFIQRIKSQSSLAAVTQMDVKIIKKYIPKNKKLNNVVLEVTPEIFNCLLKHKRIYMEWESFPIYEYWGVIRCYKCWRYGHKAIHCRQQNIVCPLCNGKHKSDECKSDSLECTNCKYAHEVLKIPDIEYRHSVFNKECICFKRAQEKIRSRTQYI